MFTQYALVEGVARVEQHGQMLRAIRPDRDPGNVSDFLIVGGCRDRTALRSNDFNINLRVVA